jgi:hypothetical protein
MATHWLVMEGSRDGAPAPFSTRLAGAGRHLPATHLVAALGRGAEHVPEGGRILLIAAGAGITAGAALYRGRGSLTDDASVIARR